MNKCLPLNTNIYRYRNIVDIYIYSCCLFMKLCLILCDSFDCRLPGSSVHGIFPGKNTGVGCHFLIHRLFPTKGSNLCLLHWQVESLPLIHQGSPVSLCCTLESSTALYISYTSIRNKYLPALPATNNKQMK